LIQFAVIERFFAYFTWGRVCRDRRDAAQSISGSALLGRVTKNFLVAARRLALGGAR
jgi:hypothetical protein